MEKRFFLCLVLLFTGCISSWSIKSQSNQSNQSDETYTCFDQASYRLFPGDKIQVSCFKRSSVQSKYQIQVNDKISVRFPSLIEYTIGQFVKPDGTINVPRLSSFHIAGLTADEAVESLQQEFKRVDWQPEFFLVIEEYDLTSLDVQSILMNSTNPAVGSVIVRPDGYADFPLVGPIPVAGKTFDNVEDSVEQRYNTIYPRLQFELNIEKITGDKIFIFGNVARPGEYTVNQIHPLYELIASAGGFLPTASMSDVLLIKIENDIVKCQTIDMDPRHLAGQKGALQGALCPGSIVYVPEKRLYTIAEITKAISEILFFRGFAVGMQWDFGKTINSLITGDDN